MKVLKSILILGFLGILFVGNIGLSVFKHACSEDGVSVSYFVNEAAEQCSGHEMDHHAESDHACCEKEQKDSDCCSDVFEYTNIKLDFHQDVNDYHFVKVADVLPVTDFVFTTQPLEEYYSSNYVNPPPPDSKEIRIKKDVWII